MGYSKYGWAANQITEEDMAQLYRLKKATKKHITTMVSPTFAIRGVGKPLSQ